MAAITGWRNAIIQFIFKDPTGVPTFAVQAGSIGLGAGPYCSHKITSDLMQRHFMGMVLLADCEAHFINYEETTMNSNLTQEQIDLIHLLIFDAERLYCLGEKLPDGARSVLATMGIEAGVERLYEENITDLKTTILAIAQRLVATVPKDAAFRAREIEERYNEQRARLGLGSSPMDINKPPELAPLSVWPAH